MGVYIACSFIVFIVFKYLESISRLGASKYTLSLLCLPIFHIIVFPVYLDPPPSSSVFLVILHYTTSEIDFPCTQFPLFPRPEIPSAVQRPLHTYTSREKRYAEEAL